MLQYVYGAYAPISNSDAVDEALRLAHRYRNRLCELELERRQKLEEALQQHCHEYWVIVKQLAQAESECEAAAADIAQARAKARARVPATTTQRQRLQTARAVAKSLRAEKAAAKTAAYRNTDYQAVLAAIQASNCQELKVARHKSGLFWGTYSMIEQNCQTFRQGNPPKFAPYRKEGSLAVQFQGKRRDTNEPLQFTTTTALHAGTSRYCRITPAGDGKGTHIVSFCIGADGCGAPVYAKIPIVMHRPMPDHASVKWAYLTRRYVGSDAQWSLRFVVDAERPNPDTENAEDVTVHVGWRLLGTVLRSAVVVDRHGNTSQFTFTERERNWLFKYDQLQSTRDQAFANMLPNIGLVPDAPEWWAELTAHWKKWKSQKKLARLVLYWREHRFEGDEELFEMFDAWRRHDKHLWNWQMHGNEKQRLRRQQAYRIFAKQLAARYGGQCYLADITTAELLEKEDVVDEITQTSLHRRHARLAATSTLKDYLKEAFRDRITIVKAENITLQCQACGFIDLELDRLRVEVRCPSCGVSIDRDIRGAMNQLASTKVVAKSSESLASEAAEGLPTQANGRPHGKRVQRFLSARKRKREANDNKDLLQ